MTVVERSAAFTETDREAPRLLALHYDELRRVARRIICSDAQRHVLQATELVNESVIRLIRSGLENVKEREHLLALAARTMRRVLIDEARRALAAKRRIPQLLTRWPDSPSAGTGGRGTGTRPSPRSKRTRRNTAGWSSSASASGSASRKPRG